MERRQVTLCQKTDHRYCDRSPWQQALSRAVIDISSRPYFFSDLPFTREKIGDRMCCVPPERYCKIANQSWFSLDSIDRNDPASPRVLRLCCWRDATCGFHSWQEQPSHVSLDSTPPPTPLVYPYPPGLDPDLTLQIVRNPLSRPSLSLFDRLSRGREVTMYQAQKGCWLYKARGRDR